MNSPIQFKGTDSISDILSNFGKIKTNRTLRFTLSIKLDSKMQVVNVPIIPNKDDKASAMESLTETERAEFERLTAKLDREAKRLASLRIDGATQERWTTRGECELV